MAPTQAQVSTAIEVLLWLEQQPQTNPRLRDEITAARVLLWKVFDTAPHPTQPAGPGRMECLAISEDRRFACTREFGHDGVHVGHGPRGRVVATWERKATDRFGSEAG